MSVQISSLTPGLMVETAAARVEILLGKARLSLRARGDLAPLNATLGLTLPDRIGRRSAASGIEVIKLGPDEWTVIAPEREAARLGAAFAALYADHPHSLVDVSGREVTLLIEGPQAEELLTLGCPRDIATIPVGEARRTVFDGATVVLWRDATDRFRMDVWNSFANHVGHLLETGARELAGEQALS